MDRQPDPPHGGKRRDAICPGCTVDIILKADQQSGRVTRGIGTGDPDKFFISPARHQGPGSGTGVLDGLPASSELTSPVTAVKKMAASSSPASGCLISSPG